MTTCTRVGEDESGRAPIDLGMAASKRGSFSVELGLSKKVPPLLADALLSEVPAPTQSTSVPECVLNKSREAISHLPGSHEIQGSNLRSANQPSF